MHSLREESQSEAGLATDDLQETWRILDPEERLEAFLDLPRAEAEDFFLELSARDEYELIASLPTEQRRSWMRLLPPDDAVDVVQEATESAERDELLALLDDQTRREVAALLAYAEDDAGGLMNPRYARVRPDISVDEAIAYLRRQGRGQLEHINYVYVLEADQTLAAVRHRQAVLETAEKRLRDPRILAPEVKSARKLAYTVAERLVALIGGNSLAGLQGGEAGTALATALGQSLLSPLLGSLTDALGQRVSLALYPTYVNQAISDGSLTNGERVAPQLVLAAEVGYDLTSRLNASLLAAPNRSDVPPQFNLNYKATNNLSLEGSVDTEGTWQTQLQLFLRF